MKFPIAKLNIFGMLAQVVLVCLLLLFIIAALAIQETALTIMVLFFTLLLGTVLVLSYLRLFQTHVILTPATLEYKNAFRHYQFPLNQVQLMQIVDVPMMGLSHKTGRHIGICIKPRFDEGDGFIMPQFKTTATQFFLMYEPDTWDILVRAVAAANPGARILTR
jgi:hypothetical protein